MSSTCPQVPIFKKFREAWPNINASKYDVGVKHAFVKSAVKKTKDQTIEFCKNSLKKKQCIRDDYKELLELTIIFLGAEPQRGISFRSPGAFHHARWMSKAIYSLKIFMFRKQFKLNAKEERAFRDICIFLVTLYVEAWFRAPLAIEAPYNDLQLLKNLKGYSEASISHAAVNKFCGHLWYLSPEAVALAFFDSRVPKDTKLKMVEATKSTEDFNIKKVSCLSKDVKNFAKKELDEFVSSKTLNFFSRFKIPGDFLEADPETWEKRKDYQKAILILSKLVVVNDVAERGIKLIQEYNNILTKDEGQKQYLLQVVDEHRKRYPDSKKETLLQK